MRVVIVNEGLAYPPKGGNWLRTLNLMLPLAARHEITYLCRGSADREAVETARAFYAEHGIRAIVSDDHPHENRGAGFHARLVANLISPLPFSIAAHRSREVRRTIRRLAATERADVWQFEGLSYADTLRNTPARTIVVAHNVETLIWERLAAMESSPLRRPYIREQRRKFERFEGRVLRGASGVVAVSAEDARLMRDRFGVRSPFVVDNGVDARFFSAGADARTPDPHEILFLGSLDWRPNLDALDVLLSSILPAVRAVEPEARLSIVGRNPPPSLVHRVRSTANADLHADVPDVRPYLARAGVMAVPLRIGGGSRLKIIEAIAAGVPVVSSRVGCEGLIFAPGRDLVVADEPDAMAAALVDAIRHPDRFVQMARSGRAVIDSHYDWRRLAGRLEEVWQAVAAPTAVSQTASESAGTAG